MTADPTSRQAALDRCKDAGRKAGLYGSKASENPYNGKPSMREEFDKWEAGRQIGAAEKKRGAK